LAGIYFRLLMVGYFEGIDAERGIAWRANDSLPIRSFPPDGPKPIMTLPPDESRNGILAPRHG
jgi:hypothetical protein